MNRIYKIINNRVTSEIAKTRICFVILSLLVSGASGAADSGEYLHMGDIVGFYKDGSYISYDETKTVSDAFTKNIKGVQNTGTATGTGEIFFGIKSQVGFLKDFDESLFFNSISLRKGNGAYSGERSIGFNVNRVKFDKETGKALVENTSVSASCLSGDTECKALFDQYPVGYGSTYSLSTIDSIKEFFEKFKLTESGKANRELTKKASVDNIKTYGALTQRLTNISDGIDDNDAVTVGQLKLQASNNYLNVNSSDELSSPTTSAKAIGAHSLALGEEAKVEGANSVAIGKGSVVLSGEDNVFSIGNSEVKRRILHVADGIEDSDAATVGQVAAVAKNSIGIESLDSEKLEISSEIENEKLNYKIKVNANGSVVAGDAGLISGNTLFNEVRVSDDVGNFVSSSNTVGQNLKALDEQVYANSKKKILAGEDITVTEQDGNFTVAAIGNGTVGGERDNALVRGSVVQDALTSVKNALKSVIDGVETTFGNATNALIDKESWRSLLGNNSEDSSDDGFFRRSQVEKALTDFSQGSTFKDVAKSTIDISSDLNSDLITVSKQESENKNKYTIGLTVASDAIGKAKDGVVTSQFIKDEVRPVDGTYIGNDKSVGQNLSILDTKIADNSLLIDQKVDKNLTGLSESGKKIIRETSQNSVAILGNDYLSVLESINSDGVKNIKLNVKADGIVSEGNKELVQGGVVWSALNGSMNAVRNAESLTSENITAWQNKLGGDVVAGDKGFVSGAKVDAAIKNIFNGLDSSGNNDYSNAVKDQARKAISVTTGENELIKIKKTTNEHEDTYNVSLVLADKIGGNLGGLVTASMIADEVRLDSDGVVVKKSNTTAGNLKKLDSSVSALQSDKLGLDLASLSSAGESKIKSLAQSSFVLEDGKHTTWNSGTQGVLHLNVEDNGTISESDTKLVTGKTVYEAIEAAKSDMASGIVGEGFAKKDASNIIEENWRSKLGTKQNVASISEENDGFITGRELTGEIKVASEGVYVKKNQSVATNLSALDSAVNDRIKSDFSNVSDWSSLASIISLQQSSDKRIALTKTLNDDGTVVWSLGITAEQAGDDDHSKLITSGAVDSKLLSYAKADGYGLTAENIAAWRSKLGGGTVDSSSTEFVTGRSVYEELRPTTGRFVSENSTTADNLVALDTGLNKVSTEIYGDSGDTLLLAKSDLSNLTSIGEEKLQTVSRSVITGMIPSNGFIDISSDGKLTVNTSDSVNNEEGSDKKLVTSKAVYEAINGQGGIATDVSKKADKDASNLQADEINAWRGKLGGGIVVAGDNGFVTGGALHSELRPENGSFVRQDVTTAGNLTSLDQALGSLTIAEGLQKDKWLTAFSGEITDAVSNGNQLKGNGFVTGSKLYSYVTPAQLSEGQSYAVISRANSVAGNLTALDTALGAIQRGQLTDATKDSISNVIFDSIFGSDLVEVTKDITSKTLTISGKTGAVAEGDVGLVTGGQVMEAIKNNTIDADYVNNAVSNAIRNDQQVQESVNQAISNILAQSDLINNAVNNAFTNMSDETVNKIASQVKATGTISADDEHAVSGKTVHDYLHGDNVELGKGSTASGTDSVAIGSGSSVTGSSSIAVGTGGVVSGNNSGIFGDPSFVGANSAYAFGNNNRIEVGSDRSFVLGNENKIAGNSAGNFVLGNSNSLATNVSDTFVLGSNVNVSEGVKNAVVLGAGSVAVSNAVSIGSAGNERRLVNVAAGSVAPGSTDAVNGGQLYETQQAFAQGMEQTARSISRVENKLHKEINRAAANSAAMAALQPLGLDEDHHWSSAAGVGTYGGEQALAVGIFYKPTENVMVSLGGSTTTHGDTMGNLGISYRFGASGTYKKAGTVSELNGKVMVLNDQNRALEAQLRSAQSREENMARSVAQSRAEVENLREELEMLKAALGLKTSAKNAFHFEKTKRSVRTTQGGKATAR